MKSRARTKRKLKLQQSISSLHPLESVFYFLLIIDIFLLILHLLFPNFDWGQGRSSYFFLGDQITLASWYMSIKFLFVGLFSIILIVKNYINQQTPSGKVWAWSGIGLLGFTASFLELTRLHERAGFLGFPDHNNFEQFFIFSSLAALVAGTQYFFRRINAHKSFKNVLRIWSWFWIGAIVLSRLFNYLELDDRIWAAFSSGSLYLIGGTFLIRVLSHAIIQQEDSKTESKAISVRVDNYLKSIKPFLYIGFLGLVLMILEIIFYRIASIYEGYITANQIISIALLGTAIGGWIGYKNTTKQAGKIIQLAGWFMPFAILLAFFGSVSFLDNSRIISSILMMMPFVCIGIINAVFLSLGNSHTLYFATMIGAGTGALLINPLLQNFLEEGSLLIVAAVFTLVNIFLLPTEHEIKGSRWKLNVLAGLSVLFLVFLVISNHRYELFNITAARKADDYPNLQVLFSRSSYISRYDILKRSPTSSSLKAYENGHVIDTIRDLPAEDHEIDPRIPNNWKENPSILIIGSSGDAITKSSTNISDDITGIEINPDIVDLQSNQLVSYNANSYAGINPVIIDGRSFVEQNDKKFDIISLLNTHFARGSLSSRAPSPEYLFTIEAFQRYFDNLNNDGIIVIEEPVESPKREIAVWKMIRTARDAITENGNESPAQHIFIFQWNTRRNNYYQIIIKKDPLTKDDVSRLYDWISEVDQLNTLEKAAGKRLGPIYAQTTVLHDPYIRTNSTFSRILRDELDAKFYRVSNMGLVTDNKPFLFNIDPAKKSLIAAYTEVLVYAVILLIPFIFTKKGWNEHLKGSGSKILPIILTGIAYMLVEIVLIQRYEKFLGSPITALLCVFASLLLSSGIGSFLSRNFKKRAVLLSISLLAIIVLAHQFIIKSLFVSLAHIPLPTKILFSILTIVPLGICMGIPFPYLIRSGEGKRAQSLTAIQYGINSLASALAVPLAFNISMDWGFQNALLVGLFLYLVIGLLIFVNNRMEEQYKPIHIICSIFTILLFIYPFLLYTNNKIIHQQESASKVYAITYGSSFVKESLVFDDGSDSTRIPFAWQFWLIDNSDKKILVDTGFHDQELADDWGVQDLEKVIELLSNLHITPEEISDVVLTHAHWDHIGNLAAFSKARIWMQSQELEYMQSQVNDQYQNQSGYRYADLQVLEAIQEESRLHLVDGDHDLYPGITLRLAGGHTPGLQFVQVKSLMGDIILASDNAYVYKNNLGHEMVGRAKDRERSYAAITTMQDLAASPFYIIPGHDPKVSYYFPEVADNIVELTIPVD